LLRLIDGYVVTQLLYVASELRVAEALPGTGPEVAERVGADPGAMTRLLRGLSLEGVVVEEDGRFALTPVGELLPAFAGALRARGELYYRGASDLLGAVQTGGTSFERVYGASFFEHLDAHPEHQAAFEASMAGRGEQEAEAVVAAYDFGAFSSLVDVGGGRGVLLAAILRTAELDATLVDREGAVEAARAFLGDRASCIVGDFFASVPAGADAYLLSRVLHDWDDADALRILRVCREAMSTEARLLVVDAILPERAVDQPFAIRMDLHMLLLLGARERTEAEFAALLAKAGFSLVRAIPTESPAGLGVIEAVRTP
jgi:O-methyltransferase domain